MTMEKGIGGAPVGEDQEGILSGLISTLSLEDALEVELEDGGIEVTLDAEEVTLESAPFGANLAEYLDEDELAAISTELTEAVDADIQSRQEWSDTYIQGLECLGFRYEERTEPWANACGVFSTVLAEAGIRFQAEAMSETFPASGPVKTKILGAETPDKREAADRVQTDMNYELTEVMVEYRPEHERMLFCLGLAGSGFKKIYYDPALKRQTALFIVAEDMIVPYGASNIETAERVTHIMRKTPNEVHKLQDSGFYRAITLGDPEHIQTDVEKYRAKQEDGYDQIEDGRYTFYEVHVDLIINGVDGNGPRLAVVTGDVAGEDEPIEVGAEITGDIPIARPYVVTIEVGTGQVLAIYRNWNENDELKAKRQHFVHYVYVPGFGFYGLGLIHIIGGYARAGTSIIRQLVDAGSLANLPAGFKAKGLRLKGDDDPIGPGEWRDVDLISGTIKDNIVPLPYKEPSPTLLALLEKITDEGRRLGAIADMNVSDMSANAPVGTTLALLERTLKPMTAVQARVHYAMKQEFKLIKQIIRDYAPDVYGYVPDRAEPRARKLDYDTVEVIPVSDPNSSTMAQRVVQYQAVEQLSKTAPQIYDLPFLHRQMIEVLGVPNADKIVPASADSKPQDPLSENMNILVGKPVKAFIYQDHQAHMMVHQAFMQDPMIAQTIGQNPLAQQIMGALQAHVVEHLAFAYRNMIEQKMGVQLPKPNEEIPPHMETQLSKLLADAAAQTTKQHQQEAAQRQAQEQAADPLFQLEQAKVQIQGKDSDIKAQEVARKAEKDRMDKEIADKKIDIERKEVQIDAHIAGVKIDQAAAEAEKTRKYQSSEATKKFRADIAKEVMKPKPTHKPNGAGK